MGKLRRRPVFACVRACVSNKYLYRLAHTPPVLTPSPPTMRVLISGAGVAGPTLAYFLARAGARVTVVERASDMLAQGQNIDLQGSAVTAIKRMGLFDELKKYNTGEVGTRFVDVRGKTFSSLPLVPGGAPSATSEFEILRGDLANLLYKATKDNPQVDYRFGATVDEVVANDDASVRVRIGGSSTVEEYDLLVAADGQWSRVRKACFPPEAIQVVDKDLYIAYFTVPRVPTDDNWWTVCVTNTSRVCTVRPDPHGTMRAMFGAMPRNEKERQQWKDVSRSGRDAQMQLTRSTFQGMGWEADRFLKDMPASPDFYLQAIQQIRMKTWSKDRVVCLGDAAYAPTPLTGAGATLAISGAYILAGELSKLGLEKSGPDAKHPGPALQSYEALFKPFTQKVQNIPWFVPGIAYPTNALHYWSLRAALSATSRVVAWRNRGLPGADSPDRKAASDGTISERDDDGFALPDYPAFA